MSRNLNNTKWFVLFLDLSEKKFCFIGQVTGSHWRAIIKQWWWWGSGSARLLQSHQVKRPAGCCTTKSHVQNFF